MNEVLMNKKVEYWENQLLDLGKRNKMISYRETKRATLKVLEPGFDELFTRIVVNEEELTFQKPVDKDSDIRIYSILTLMDTLSAPIEISFGDIKTEGTVNEARKTLKNLRSRSKLALDEQGNNILYLVFGFIEWYEKSPKENGWLKSPLILVPVSLIRNSLNGPYILKKYDDDIVVNPTLAYLFARDYHFELPAFDADENTLTGFFAQMEKLADQRGWKILRECSIGLVSFLKINMYKDLVSHEEQIKNNPIIRAFAGEHNEVNAAGEDVAFAHDAQKAADTFQVVGADSSQQDAVLLAKNGVSFVMQGPPGTGKSQTITNIIAEGLANGKKILFVSEKMAALEVVYKRLTEVHLADFCLALHSHKANKVEVLRELEKNLEVPKIRVKKDEILKLTELDVIRESLQSYVKDIHNVVSPLEMSLYEVYGELVQLADLPDFPLELAHIEKISKDQINRLCLLVSDYDQAKLLLGPQWDQNAWRELITAAFGIDAKLKLKADLENSVRLMATLEKMPLATKSFAETITFDRIEAYHNLFTEAAFCEQVPAKWYTRKTDREEYFIQELRKLKGKIKELNAELAAQYGTDYLQMDAAHIGERLNDDIKFLGEDVFGSVSAETLFAKRWEYHAQLNELLSGLQHLADVYQELAGRYELKGEGTFEALHNYFELAEILLLHRHFHEPYLRPEQFVRIRQLLAELPVWFAAESDRRKQILAQYPESVLQDVRISELLQALHTEQALLDNPAILNLPGTDKIETIINSGGEQLRSIKAAVSSEYFFIVRQKFGLQPPERIVEAEQMSIAIASVLENRKYQQQWENEAFRKKAQSLLEQAVSCDCQRTEAQKQLQQIYAETGLLLEADAVTAETVEILSRLQQSYEEPARLVSYCQDQAAYQLLEQITMHRSDLKAIKSNLASLQKQYGLAADYDPLTLLGELLVKQDQYTACRPVAAWKNSLNEAKRLLAQQIEMRDKLKTLYEQIIASCEVSAFELDYEAILNRFKTEYTNFFKMFRSSYRKDVKAIRLAYRNVRKKISDQEIIELLQLIKLYHEAAAAYGAASEEMEALLGVTQADLNYKWEELENRIAAFEDITKYFINSASAFAFLDNNWMDPLIGELTRYRDQEIWFTENQGAVYFGMRYQKADTEESAIKEDLEQAAGMLDYFVSAESYLALLKNPLLRKKMGEAEGCARTILVNQDWFLKSTEEIQTYIGITEPEEKIDWHQHQKDLMNYQTIISTFGPAAGRKLIAAGDADRLILSEYQEVLQQCLKLKQCYKLVNHCETLPTEFDTFHLSDLILRTEQVLGALKRLTEIGAIVNGLRLQNLAAESIAAIEIELTLIVTHQRETQQYQLQQEEYRQLLGAAYQGADTDWEPLRKEATVCERILEIAGGELSAPLLSALLSDQEIYAAEQLSELQALLGTVMQFEEKRAFLSNTISLQAKTDVVSAAMTTMNEYVEICDTLSEYAFGNQTFAEIFNDISRLGQLQMDQQMYQKQLHTAAEMFPSFQIDDHTDWGQMLQIFEHVKKVKRLLSAGKVDQEIADFITEGAETTLISERLTAIEDIIRNKKMLTDLAGMFCDKKDLLKGPLNDILERFRTCLGQFASLDSWLHFQDCRKLCRKNGLAVFIEAAEMRDYPSGMLQQLLWKSFYYRWFQNVCGSMEAAAKFSVPIQEGKIKSFRSLDDEQLPIAQMRIRERLVKAMPSKFMISHVADEMSVLRREIGKKRKIMPLRKLFRSIPNLLLKLKPCLMMSPLSVSYFLEADTYQFDLVIFDEASQIFPQDAIGAIFRSSQVIIAGDSKQLPPTSFFTASTDNSDNDFDSEEEEAIIYDSILEEASRNLPNRYLLWHYRSRDEDLISFSNQHIYRGNLITFPSSVANAAHSGVEYIYVEDGVYENRCNKNEALCCVRLVEEHIKKHPQRSLGIIAFSESQQSAIEEELQEFRLRHRQYESFFDEQNEAPFFIKNLENVQGDERDTIIFSICYGRNPQGRMYMRFGPLGNHGGERRLNVAITRAKYNVKLVSSILPADIDLNKTKSEGVKMLRAYLEFAMKGSSALLPPKIQKPLYESDTFSQGVASFLMKKGYQVKQNVGSSDYTIDIAVRHPKRRESFIAGIECDGNSYYMARTVRDREHLRTAILEQMGWHMYRVWSTEWIRNPEKEQQRLLDFLSIAMNDDETVEEQKSPAIEIAVAFDEIVEELDAGPADPDNPYELPLYQVGDWRNVKRFRARDEISMTADRILEIVKVEQPLHIDLLYRRLASAFGNEKVTQPIKETVNQAIRGRLRGKIKVAKEFITLSGFTGAAARRSPPGMPDRNIAQISKAECMAVMKVVLQGAIGTEKKSLILETARVFGFERTGPKIKLVLEEAIKELEDQKLIRISDGKIQLLEETNG